MGKRRVNVVVVRKPVTVALLVLTTIVMAALIYGLSGRAFTANHHPVRELLSRLLGADRPAISTGAVVASLMPVVAHVLLFVPWGFLAFLALDAPQRKRTLTYGLTVLTSLVFAVAVYVWQQFLPTRVTALPDALANAAGALGGAALGHARKSVRVRFDF